MLGAVSAVPGLAFATVTHELTFPELRQQYIHVTSRFPTDDSGLDVRLPTWTPGSYVQQPFDASLEILSVEVNGVPVSWRKTEKDSWRIESGAGDVTVRYRVHADRRSVSASWASEDYVSINGASVFLYSDDTREQPQELKVAPPRELPQVATPLVAGNSGTWLADDYDELVDSPVVLSAAAPIRFRVDDHGYRFLNVGDDRLWDTPRAVADLEAMVTATNELFEDVPLDRDYWFMNVLNEETGGLEHDHATLMQASRWQMRDRADYVRWLSLAAHEYIHAWNVRRMRPAALARYDYRREQYTGSLWIAEGVTSYYDDLVLSWARLVSPAEYLERLAAHIHALELRPGRLQQSLADASREAWTHQYQPRPNALNQSVSYYVKGAVVAFVLDARLRSDSRGRRSLDDVLQLLWQRWGTTPYPEDALFEAVVEIGDEDVAAWLRPLVDGVAEPNVDEALEWFGLQLERNSRRTAAEESNQPVPAGLGINWDLGEEALVAATVIAGGAAASAGVLPGDELLAVNGERLRPDNYEHRLRRLAPGETVELLLSRQDRIQTVTARLAEARPTRYVVQARPGFADRHRRRLRSWLGQPLSDD